MGYTRSVTLGAVAAEVTGSWFIENALVCKYLRCETKNTLCIPPIPDNLSPLLKMSNSIRLAEPLMRSTISAVCVVSAIFNVTKVYLNSIASVCMARSNTKVVPKLPKLPNLRSAAAALYCTPSRMITSCLVTVAEAHEINVHVPFTVRSVVIAVV